VIRTATIKDTPVITELWRRTNLLRPWNNPEQDIEQALTTETSTILVFETDDKIIGTIMAGYDGHRGWIYYMAVEPEYQRNGYAKQLVASAEEWLKSRGAPKVHLLTRKGNEEVQQFYTKIGYEISDVTVMQKTFEENK
jgi:ribosomal protein S18 acetylase RimI-like enzyme